MNNIDRRQQKLLAIGKEFFVSIEWPNLRAVSAQWENETLYINFFFNKDVTDEILENASVVASEIIAQFVDGFLEEKYIVTEGSEELPKKFIYIYKN